MLSLYPLKESSVCLSREPNLLSDVEDSIPGRFLNIDGKRVHLVEKGAGEPIIFIHGLGFNTYMWEYEYFSRLSESNHVMAIDLYGFGFSERLIGENYGFELWEKQVLDVINLLNIDNAILVGHSMGGAICSLLAANYPERFSKLVILSGLAPQKGNENSISLSLLRIPFIGVFLLNLLKVIPPINPFDSKFSSISSMTSSINGTRDAIASYLRNNSNFPRLIKAYSRISIPTLVIHGEYDKVNPISTMDRVAKDIDDCRYVKLGSGGHRIRDHFLNPNIVIEEIVQFILGYNKKSQVDG